jgi:hypothetical protein
MRINNRGRLFALVAASALIAVPAYGQSNGSTEQNQAYQQAVQEGPGGLIAFMRAFPSSPLIPQVIAALGGQIGAEAAIQAALDAGVPTETVLAVAADIAPGVFAPTGQVSTGQVSAARPDVDNSNGPY